MKNVVSKNGVWKTAPLNDTPSGGVLVVTDTDGTLDKTWQEIHDAFPNVYIAEDGTMNTILMIYGDSGEYGVVMADGLTTATFVSTSASGYPAVQ